MDSDSDSVSAENAAILSFLASDEYINLVVSALESVLYLFGNPYCILMLNIVEISCRRIDEGKFCPEKNYCVGIETIIPRIE